MLAPSVVLLEIDATGFAIFELEGDAPRSIDVDRIALRIKPLQRMKIEARNVHFLGSDGDIETIEPCENSFVQSSRRSSNSCPWPIAPKGFAFESSDHDAM